VSESEPEPLYDARYTQADGSVQEALPKKSEQATLTSKVEENIVSNPVTGRHGRKTPSDPTFKFSSSPGNESALFPSTRGSSANCVRKSVSEVEDYLNSKHNIILPS